jgi:hypothetical protein
MDKDRLKIIDGSSVSAEWEEANHLVPPLVPPLHPCFLLCVLVSCPLFSSFGSEHESALAVKAQPLPRLLHRCLLSLAVAVGSGPDHPCMQLHQQASAFFRRYHSSSVSNWDNCSCCDGSCYSSVHASLLDNFRYNTVYHGSKSNFECFF